MIALLGPLLLLAALAGCDGSAGVDGEDGDGGSATPAERPSTAPRPGALEAAYREDSDELLDAYFRDWEAQMPALTADQRASLSKTHRALYEVFEAFYTPGDLLRIADGQFGPDIYSGFPYYAVQNELEYTVANRVLKEGSIWQQLLGEPRELDSGTIEDFRPRVTAEGRRFVFLNGVYRQALVDFLGSDLAPVGAGGDIMAPSFPEGESAKRVEFLGREIKVWAGHWHGWLIATHPRIDRITIDRRLKKAKVRFTLVYEGGEAIVERTRKGWVIRSSELLWIQ